MKVDHERYIRSTRRTIGEGEPTREDDVEVDAEHVRNYLEAREFFKDLGGTETHRRLSGGVLSVKAENPAGTEVVKTIFTPVRK